MAMPRGSAIISRIVRFTHRVAEMEPCGERDADEGSMVHDGGANASEPPISEVLVEESSEALLAVSADGVIVSWNRAAERITVDVSMRALRDSAGGLRFVAVNETDVSSLIRLRAAHAAGARFRGLLEAAPDAMVIVGEHGRIALINGQTERLFGYTRDELHDQPIEVLVPERFRAVHPAHRAGYFGDARARPMGAGLGLFGRRKAGSA